MYLYVDSADDLSLGLIDKDYRIIEFKEIKAKKTSLVLQKSILELLAAHNLKLNTLSGVIFCSGPGSYTGMRVGQGFVDICKW